MHVFRSAARSATLQPAMMRGLRSVWATARRATVGALAATMLLGQAPLGAQAAQPPGQVTGLVTDEATGQPLQQVRVLVAGTQIGTLTADNGRYTLRGVTPGTVQLDINRIGYEPKKVTVQVPNNTPAVLNVTLKQAAFSLAAVVTTVTGQQKKVELANSTTQINVAEKIAELPVTNMGGLLSGRASSVQVISSGATGTGSRIRIRGQNSFSLSNDPIVIIDGVRATSTTNNGIGTGGTGPSRLDDINPAEIENIEVVKGPSAATLYGTEAANGVVVITTKRGKSGRTRYNLTAENGRIENVSDFPDLWSLWGKTAAAPTVSRICTLIEVAAGTCVSTDSLSRGNVLNDSRLTPINTGDRQLYNLQASGGTDKVQFFVSGQTETETGIYKMPELEITRLQARRGVGELPSDIMRPNALARNSLRANLSAELRPNLFVQVQSGFVNSGVRTPQNEDNGNGLMVAALGGLWRGDLLDAQGDSLRGYRSFMMGDVLSQTTTNKINRFINSLSAQWTPTSWLSARASLGSDYTDRDEMFIAKVGEGPNTGITRTGSITSQQAIINQQTADYSGTGKFRLTDWLQSTTSVGMQYVRNLTSFTTGTGQGLPPGGVTVSSAATRNATQGLTERRTLGYYVEQQLNLREKLFLTGGVRRDAASAFGKNNREVYYPKFGASWLVSDESFFPQASWLNAFRVRGTYGASGQIPGATDAILFFSPTPLTLASGDAPGATLGSLGNTNLKPEFSAETEYGFDLTLFGGASNIDLTYYKKQTTDALIDRLIAPSLSGITTQTVNIGNIQNSGIELTWNQRLIDRQQLAFSFLLTGSTNANKMTKLGDGVSPIASGNRNTQRNLPGYPLFGLWDKPIRYQDANNDGIITNAELLSTADTAIYQGATFPRREVAFTPTVELFNRKLRITSQFDSKFGLLKLNNTKRHQCQGGASCRGLYDRDAGLYEQAIARAAAVPNNIFTGMMEDGDFTRWRELSVSYDLPARFASAVRSSRVNLVLTGRNLMVWTKYSGVDPEANQSSTDTRGNEEFFSTPPLRYFTFRVNFGF